MKLQNNTGKLLYLLDWNGVDGRGTDRSGLDWRGEERFLEWIGWYSMNEEEQIRRELHETMLVLQSINHALWKIEEHLGKGVQIAK